MDQRDGCKYSADSGRPDEPASERGKASGKIGTVTRAMRATSAIVVFGIPLVTGAAAVLGYGVYRAYKRITGGP